MTNRASVPTPKQIAAWQQTAARTRGLTQAGGPGAILSGLVAALVSHKAKAAQAQSEALGTRQFNNIWGGGTTTDPTQPVAQPQGALPALGNAVQSIFNPFVGQRSQGSGTTPSAPSQPQSALGFPFGGYQGPGLVNHSADFGNIGDRDAERRRLAADPRLQAAGGAQAAGNPYAGIRHPNDNLIVGGSGSDFNSRLARSESGGNYNVTNSEGYGGKYQFGQDRLDDYNRVNGTDFKVRDLTAGTPQARQLTEAVQNWHLNDIDNYIRSQGLDRYVGSQVNGVDVTWDGMRAAAHLGGKGGLKKFLLSGGQYNPADSNGTSLTHYMAKFGHVRGEQHGRAFNARHTPGEQHGRAFNARHTPGEQHGGAFAPPPVQSNQNAGLPSAVPTPATQPVPQAPTQGATGSPPTRRLFWWGPDGIWGPRPGVLWPEYASEFSPGIETQAVNYGGGREMQLSSHYPGAQHVGHPAVIPQNTPAPITQDQATQFAASTQPAPEVVPGLSGAEEDYVFGRTPEIVSNPPAAPSPVPSPAGAPAAQADTAPQAPVEAQTQNRHQTNPVRVTGGIVSSPNLPNDPLNGVSVPAVITALASPHTSPEQKAVAEAVFRELMDRASPQERAAVQKAMADTALAAQQLGHNELMNPLLLQRAEQELAHAAAQEQRANALHGPALTLAESEARESQFVPGPGDIPVHAGGPNAGQPRFPNDKPRGTAPYEVYLRSVPDGVTPLSYIEFDRATRSGDNSGIFTLDTPEGRKHFSEATHGKLPSGYQWVWDNETKAPKQVPIPGGPKDATRAEATQKVQKAIENNNTIRLINKVIAEIDDGGFPVAGLGGHFLGKIPGSDAFDTGENLESITVEKVFAGIKNLRDSSPTGATGFGPLNQKEGGWLERRIVSLAQGQSPEQLRENLVVIKNIVMIMGTDPTVITEADLDARLAELTTDQPRARLGSVGESVDDLTKYMTPEDRELFR